MNKMYCRMMISALVTGIICNWYAVGFAADTPDSTGGSVAASWLTQDKPHYTLYYTAEDSAVLADLSSWFDTGCAAVEEFLTGKFAKKFDVYIFPDRASLDRQWAADWDAPGFASECWMVASGVAHRLDVLSPRVWATETCEHDAADTAATRRLLTHELVHVFHGQHNPVPDFTGLDSIGWFIEGLAVLVSGRLDSSWLADAIQVVKEDRAPARLAQFWSGKERYALAGSLVSFVDRKYSRERISQLLRATSQTEILKLLNTTEESLISDWEKSAAGL
jgi:hypothetical protein